MKAPRKFAQLTSGLIGLAGGIVEVNLRTLSPLCAVGVFGAQGLGMPKATGKSPAKAPAAKAPAAAAEAAAASSGEKATGGLGLLSSMYGDDDEDDDEAAAAVQAARTSSSTMVVQAAPYVMTEAPSGHELAVLDKGTEDKKTSQTVVYVDPC